MSLDAIKITKIQEQIESLTAGTGCDAAHAKLYGEQVTYEQFSVVLNFLRLGEIGQAILQRLSGKSPETIRTIASHTLFETLYHEQVSLADFRQVWTAVEARKAAQTQAAQQAQPQASQPQPAGTEPSEQKSGKK